MRYSEYFGDLLNAQKDADRAIFFFERLARYFADRGRDIRSGDAWKSLAGRLGFEYHPQTSLKGTAERISPDWEGIDGLRLFADYLTLTAQDNTDQQACRLLAGQPPYTERYQDESDLDHRLHAVREQFGWLLEILDQAGADGFPAERAFVETFSIAAPSETTDDD